MKLPSEEFLIPVERFNHAVGPLFAEFKGRFPLCDHNERSLQHSLGIFLNCVYRTAMEDMEKLRPTQLTREQWNHASPETKAEHMHWQRNLQYLRQRLSYFQSLLMPHREVGR